MFYRSTYIVINDDWEPVVVGNWTKLQVSSFETSSGGQLMSLRLGDFDCINKTSCGYFYASIVALCMPPFLFAMYIGFFAKELFFVHKYFKPCLFCFAPLVTTLMPLFKVAGKVT